MWTGVGEAGKPVAGLLWLPAEFQLPPEFHRSCLSLRPFNGTYPPSTLINKLIFFKRFE